MKTLFKSLFYHNIFFSNAYGTPKNVQEQALRKITHLWRNMVESSGKTIFWLSPFAIHERGWRCCSALILKGIFISLNWNIKVV